MAPGFYLLQDHVCISGLSWNPVCLPTGLQALNIPGKFPQVRTAGSDPAVVPGYALGGDLHLGTGAFRFLHCSLLSIMEN